MVIGKSSIQILNYFLANNIIVVNNRDNSYFVEKVRRKLSFCKNIFSGWTRICRIESPLEKSSCHLTSEVLVIDERDKFRNAYKSSAEIGLRE